jgi:hypothetical protein
MSVFLVKLASDEWGDVLYAVESQRASRACDLAIEHAVARAKADFTTESDEAVEQDHFRVVNLSEIDECVSVIADVVETTEARVERTVEMAIEDKASQYWEGFRAETVKWEEEAQEILKQAGGYAISVREGNGPEGPDQLRASLAATFSAMRRKLDEMGGQCS